MYLSTFDPFTYLRFAECVANQQARDKFLENFPVAHFSEQHRAIGIHTFRMLAAEALLLLLLQIKSGKHILEFMKWCQGKTLRDLLDRLACRLPPIYAGQMTVDDFLVNSITCDLPMASNTRAAMKTVLDGATAFIIAEAEEYLKTDPFNAIKHGGRFAPGFTEISIEMEPNHWVKPFVAEHGVTAFNYKTEGEKFVLETHSLELDPDNDLERIRGITSLLSIAKTTRLLSFGEGTVSEVWLYPLVEATPRARTSFRNLFVHA